MLLLQVRLIHLWMGKKHTSAVQAFCGSDDRWQKDVVTTQHNLCICAKRRETVCAHPKLNKSHASPMSHQATSPSLTWRLRVTPLLDKRRTRTSNTSTFSGTYLRPWGDQACTVTVHITTGILALYSGSWFCNLLEWQLLSVWQEHSLGTTPCHSSVLEDVSGPLCLNRMFGIQTYLNNFIYNMLSV